MKERYKILTVVGARPQFIKAAVISRIIKKSKDFTEIIVHTGQHYDENMSEVFFDELDIPNPNYRLNIGNLPHGAMTGRMLEEIEKIILLENPDLVMVYGDTNSTLAGALAAKKLHYKIAHIEAGLRSFDMKMPEEVNRVLTDRISDLLFCPTETAVTNLKKEDFKSSVYKIYNSGDVMFDAVLFYKDKAISNEAFKAKFKNLPKKFVLCTIHRAENTDSPVKLESILSSLERINDECKVILPLHPRTKKLIHLHKAHFAVEMINPVSYLEMLYLLGKCQMVLTDSGGLQKEAFFLKKLCITLRNSTEWVELIKHKVNFLAGNEDEKIFNYYKKCLVIQGDFTQKLYGDGNAGDKIINLIRKNLQ